MPGAITITFGISRIVYSIHLCLARRRRCLQHQQDLDIELNEMLHQHADNDNIENIGAADAAVQPEDGAGQGARPKLYNKPWNMFKDKR